MGEIQRNFELSNAHQIMALQDVYWWFECTQKVVFVEFLYRIADLIIPYPELISAEKFSKP